MDQFLSQPATPISGTFDPTAMARGEPGLPTRFRCQSTDHTVAHVLRTWKSSNTGLCGETYLRRHWYEIQTTTGLRITLYCERQARNLKKPKQRWWVYTIAAPTPSQGTDTRSIATPGSTARIDNTCFPAAASPSPTRALT